MRLLNGLKKGMHIDRFDNSNGYSPFNCRVVTPIENANNRRNTKWVEYNGFNYPLMELLRVKELDNNRATIEGRIKRGWSIENAIDTPIKDGNYKRNNKKVQSIVIN